MSTIIDGTAVMVFDGIVGDPRTKTWTRVFALAAPDKLTALIKHMECE